LLKIAAGETISKFSVWSQRPD